MTIYYLVSEALSNAVKYAGATRVRVEVTQGTDRVVAEVADDGAGGADPAAGSGLAGLASRIEALGGTLEVTSPAGAGTRLRARIPLAPWRTAREPFLEFGHEDDGGAGAELIAKVLSGEKTASISLAREWELEGGTPKIGQRLPVMDHRGRRHGTVEVVRIAVMPFGEVDAGSVEEHESGLSRRRVARRPARLLRPLPRAGRVAARRAGLAPHRRRAARRRCASSSSTSAAAPPVPAAGRVGAS